MWYDIKNVGAKGCKLSMCAQFLHLCIECLVIKKKIKKNNLLVVVKKNKKHLCSVFWFDGVWKNAKRPVCTWPTVLAVKHASLATLTKYYLNITQYQVVDINSQYNNNNRQILPTESL